jgi:hypothetical protein
MEIIVSYNRCLAKPSISGHFGHGISCSRLSDSIREILGVKQNDERYMARSIERATGRFY